MQESLFSGRHIENGHRVHKEGPQMHATNQALMPLLKHEAIPTTKTKNREIP